MANAELLLQVAMPPMPAPITTAANSAGYLPSSSGHANGAPQSSPDRKMQHQQTAGAHPRVNEEGLLYNVQNKRKFVGTSSSQVSRIPANAHSNVD